MVRWPCTRSWRPSVRAGLTPYQALLTGTRHPAEYFHARDSAGTVAVGKRADLVLLTGNPLADVANVEQPAGTMIGGRWLSREMVEQHEAERKAQAKARRAKLRPSTP
jgi:adenine deaminase